MSASTPTTSPDRPPAPTAAAKTGRWRHPSVWFLLAVAVASVAGYGIRWANIAVVRPVCDPPLADPDPDCYELYAGVSDPLYGHLQGRLIADGHFFVNPFHAIGGTDTTITPEAAIDGTAVADSRPSAGDPPLYQLTLAAVTALGIESGQGHRHASAVIGLTAIPLLALLVRRLANERAGVIAATIAAIHPLLWINDSMLLSEALYAPLIVAGLIAAVAYRDVPRPATAAALGAAIALAALTRGEAGMLFILLVTPLIAVTALPARTRLRHLTVAAAAAAVFIVPWNIWINTQFTKPVIMTSASGQVLTASSCDDHFYGTPRAIHIFCPVDTTIPDSDDESVRDAAKRDYALDYIEDNLDQLPVVAAIRALRMWDLYGPEDNLGLDIAVEDRGDFASHAGLAVYYGLIPFTIVGLISLRRRKETLIPYAAIAATVTITAATTFALTRYRIPADVAIVAVAAVGIDATIGAITRRRRQHLRRRDATTPVSASGDDDRSEA